MTLRKSAVMLGALALVAAMVVVVVVPALAQSGTMPTPGAPTTPKGLMGGMGFGMGFGGSWKVFDTEAAALGLTPTQLFEELHSGKSLSDVATAKGVDLQKIQDAAKTARTQAMKDAISQAVKDGKMTQAQADWLNQGLDQGFYRGGLGGGRGPMMRGGMRGFGGKLRPAAPAATPGTAS